MEKDLGYRRVQHTGRGSYIISLPKEWVQNLGLEKGSAIAFKKLDDSSLSLTPRKIVEGRTEKESGPQEYWIHIVSREDPQTVCRKIVSLYVVGADLIHIHFKDGSLLEHRLSIKNLTLNTLLGAEIVEELPNKLTLQILINHPDFPVETSIRRMAALALSANKDCLLAIRNMDETLVQNVISTCHDVSRLDVYVIRQLKFGLERELYKEMGFQTPKEFLGYRIVANDIKSIANNAINIAHNIVTLKKLMENQILYIKEPLDDEVYSQILHFNSVTNQLFEEVLKALFKRSYEQADQIISKLASFDRLETDLIALVSNKKLDPNLSSLFRLALDSSRRVVEYCRDIAEVTLHRTVEEISATPPI